MIDLFDEKRAVDLLVANGCSCVICNGKETSSFFRKGVADLLFVLENNPEMLDGAFIADRVVGKAAAALMITGGVKRVYALTISRPALELFGKYGMDVSFGVLTEHVINRKGTDWCPLEKLYSGNDDAAGCVLLIKDFFNANNKA